jgi:site-specific DNA-methyltransferase (adenine-specific)
VGEIKPYFQKGKITIYHGDALFIIPQLKKVGAMITDPPYSSGGQFRGDRTRSTVSKYVRSGTAVYRPEFGGDSRDQRSYLAWSSLWMSAARSVSIVGAPIMCFTDWRQLPVTTDAVQCGGWTWRGLATWWKPGIRMQESSFSHSAEYIVHGTNGPSNKGYSGAQQNVCQCAPVSDKKHIAEKPRHVMQWLMSIIPNTSLVLDPFMGSGVTLLTAMDFGLAATGIEIDEKSCEVAAKRIKNYD